MNYSETLGRKTWVVGISSFVLQMMKLWFKEVKDIKMRSECVGEGTGTCELKFSIKHCL